MALRDAARGWALPAAALTTYLAVEVLRLWLPTVRFVLAAGDAPVWPAATMVLGCLTAALLAVPLVRTGLARTTWTSAVLLLVLGRVILQVPTSSTVRLAVASTAMIAAVGAMAILAGSGPEPVAAYLGVHVGVVMNTVGHLALSTHDIVWRTDPAAVAVTAALGTATLWVAARLRQEPGWSTGSPATTAWPWLLPGPILLLTGVLSGVPARAAVATGWSDGTIAAVLALAHLVGATAAFLVAPRPRPWHGLFGATLVLVGTAGALRPAGLAAVMSQVMLAIGVGVIVGVAATATTASSEVRRSVAVVASWLVLAAATVLYYATYDLTIRLNNRTILLVVAVGIAAAGAVASRQARRTVVPPPPPVPTGRSPGWVLIASVALLAALVGLAASPPPITVPAPGNDDTVTVALLNVQSGFDADGRFRVRETAAVLAAADPDLIILNEVDRGWLIAGGHDVLRLLARELDLAAVFGPAADEVWGNAILTRFPVDEVSLERLPRGDAPMARSQLATVVRMTDTQQLAVVGSHLSLRVGPEDGTRLAQARAVAGTVARYRERGLPVVVGGSFNVAPETPELQTFDPLVRPVLPQGSVTWPSTDPTEHLDHLLVSEDLARLELSMPFVQVSDHLPVFVTLRLEPA